MYLLIKIEEWSGYTKPTQSVATPVAIPEIMSSLVVPLLVMRAGV